MKRKALFIAALIFLPSIVFGGGAWIFSNLPPFDPVADVGKVLNVSPSGMPQWVTASSAGSGSFLPLSGGTLTGQLGLVTGSYSVTGSTQAAATAITTDVAYINGGTNGGVALPACTAGKQVIVIKPDNGTITMKVYPINGGSDLISPNAANTGLSFGSSPTTILFTCIVTHTWVATYEPTVYVGANTTGIFSQAINFQSGATMLSNLAMGNNQITSSGLITASDITFNTTLGIVGSVTNDSASAGSVGEVKTGSLGVGSATGLSSGSASQIASIALTAGDWRCSGGVCFDPGGAVTYATAPTKACIDTASATCSNYGAPGSNKVSWGTLPATSASGVDFCVTVPPFRVSLAGSATEYLNAVSTFAVSTLSAYGEFECIRIR